MGKDTIAKSENVHDSMFPDNIDGGALLQKILCNRQHYVPRNIRNILLLHVKELRIHVTVVVSGYSDKPSTKDTANEKRSFGH